MRKLILAAVALAFTFGFAVAGEMMFVSYDAATKELKVKEKKDSPETTFKITDSTVFKAGDKDVPSEKALGRLEKMKAGKGKIDVTGSDGKATEVKFLAGKKKDKQ